MAAAAFVVFRYTRWGFEVDMIGGNERAAEFAGMPVIRRVVVVMLVSGAIVGVSGVLHLAGPAQRLNSSISNNYGLSGFIVAALAGSSVLGVVAGSIFIATVLHAGITLQSDGLSVYVVAAVYGLVLMGIAVGEAAARYRVLRGVDGTRTWRQASMSLVADILQTALPASTSVALAASGEMLNERAGTLNLGQEGVLSLGAVAAFMVGTNTRNPYLALAVGMLVGSLAGAVFASAAVVVRANQVLAGLALAVGGIGLANQLGNGRQGSLLISRFKPVEVPVLVDIPLVGRALFDQDPVVYFTFFVLPVMLWFILFQTRHGMNLRAVGENPAAADAVGVNVTGMRFAYATIGATLSGAGGAHLVLGYTQNWSIGVVSGAGWVSLAVVIFAAWRPFLVVLGSLLFGAMTSLGFIAQARGWDVPSYVLAMLPYLVTLVLILVPAGLAGFSRRFRASAAPASLAIAYFREDR